jgi:hypothetical protein
MIAFRSAGSLTNPMNFASAATFGLERGPAISEDGGAGAHEGVEDDVAAARAVAHGVGDESDRFDRRWGLSSSIRPARKVLTPA